MSSLSVASKSLLKVSRRLAEWPRLSDTRIPRIAGFALLVVYAALATGAYFSTLDPPRLSLKIGLCSDAPCVTWVMPASPSWDHGARPGMGVQSVDGRPATEFGGEDFPITAVREAELVGPRGDVLRVEATLTPIGQGPMRFSLWVVGALFALLGAAVLLRRPDLYTAKVFGVFAAIWAAGLAVAPSAGGPAPQWALVLQVLSLIGAGGSFFALTVALLEERSPARPFRVLFVGLGIVIAAGYGASVLAAPKLYDLVRPVLFLYVSACLIGAIALLAARSARGPLPHRRQARIVLWGTVLSALPFVSLTPNPPKEGLGDSP